MQRHIPTFGYEKSYYRRYRRIAGIDEVGVGPLAGPVVAAALILDPNRISPGPTAWWRAVRDSKLLSHRQREELAKIIFENSLSVGLGAASVAEIDELNIFHARLIAMKRAVEHLKVIPDFVIVDGKTTIPGIAMAQQCVVDGDAKILSVASASIIAKVTRDSLLNRLHERYPVYGFDQHKGYPTKLHRQRLREFGPCEEHRKSFAPVQAVLSSIFSR